MSPPTISGANRAWRVEADRRRTNAENRALPTRHAGGGGVASPVLRIQIIGGNPMASGIESLQYAATVTVPQVYDPDVDTSYVQGLGNGWLFIDGIRQPNRVLVRHDFIGDQTPLITGRRVATRGTVTLTYSATDMTAYLLDWI